LVQKTSNNHWTSVSSVNQTPFEHLLLGKKGISISYHNIPNNNKSKRREAIAIAIMPTMLKSLLAFFLPAILKKIELTVNAIDSNVIELGFRRNMGK
jgi:hypothetical protein